MIVCFWWLICLVRVVKWWMMLDLLKGEVKLVEKKFVIGIVVFFGLIDCKMEFIVSFLGVGLLNLDF